MEPSFMPLPPLYIALHYAPDRLVQEIDRLTQFAAHGNPTREQLATIAERKARYLSHLLNNSSRDLSNGNYREAFASGAWAYTRSAGIGDFLQRSQDAMLSTIRVAIQNKDFEAARTLIRDGYAMPTMGDSSLHPLLSKLDAELTQKVQTTSHERKKARETTPEPDSRHTSLQLGKNRAKEQDLPHTPQPSLQRARNRGREIEM